MASGKIIKYKLEADVDDYVKAEFKKFGLKKAVDYNEKSAMSEYMKEALKGAAKTKSKKYFGVPDFHIEKYKIPIIIENKLGVSKLIAVNKSGIKTDEKSIKDYAVNGAIYYARNMIESKKYDEVIAIGIAGDDEENIQVSVYYVFSSSIEPKHMKSYTSLGFVQNNSSFDAFYNEATVTEAEKHEILIRTREELLKHSKTLNKLMNNHNIGVDQRVVYVSGMLLSMQDVLDENEEVIDCGLTPDDLKGIKTEQKRDGVVIIKHLEEYLDRKSIPLDKKKIMLDSFKMAISLDAARDIPVALDKSVGKLLNGEASITKQIFTYLYENIFKAIDLTSGALDIMAEMYSTFLKYALSDGAPLGKVLTPPYITATMAKILDVNKDSRVMDLATGSAAFLVAAMDLMIDDANKFYGKSTDKAKDCIEDIKHTQLLGVEIDAKMYTLAATNMILRGDGSTQIKKADTFSTPENLYSEFRADTLLLNPPFSYTDNGLPFFEFGLDHMEKGGKGAVIIQDSAGAGKALTTTTSILKKHKMLASIKMPADLFEPNATVQTSIYIFEAGTPHNYEYDIVKFIDFRNDGYKRTKRCISDVDHPTERYQDLYLIYKLGFNAVKRPEFHSELWDIKTIYCEDTITESGKDWNFESHFTENTTPEDKEYYNNIDNHFAWEINNLITSSELMLKNDEELKKCKTKDFPITEVFRIESTECSYNKSELTEYSDKDNYDYITRTVANRGICEKTGFIEEKGLCEAGTFSLGLLQMQFFYREKPWYAGQFMRKITCKFELDKYTGLFMETVLNGLSQVLLSGLVRDVDTKFNEMTINLPCTEEEKIDFEYMRKYVKAREKDLIGKLFEIYGKD